MKLLAIAISLNVITQSRNNLQCSSNGNDAIFAGIFVLTMLLFLIFILFKISEN